MQNLLEKYATVLLENCLKIKENEPLFISCPMERYDFLRILTKKAYQMGIKDIYFDVTDNYIKHEQLQNLPIENLQQNEAFNGKALGKYALKNAAVLQLCTEYPGLMSDIDSNKLREIKKCAYENSETYYKKAKRNELAWCIAAVPSYDWAIKLFPKSQDPVLELWHLIFKLCFIDEEDPVKKLTTKIELSAKRAQKINSLNIDYLHYQNSLGTNLKIKLPINYIFNNIKMTLQDNRVIWPNLPSEEIYSSPLKTGVNGVVYSSKPLLYNGKIIEDFMLEFKDGKVINYSAKKGQEDLKNIIEFDENSCYLGEVALVEYDSRISQENRLFYTTLYDENASCHLALGQSFSDSIKSGITKSLDELENLGLNQSKIHVDFMIGTKDLCITAYTHDNQQIPIFKDGNFTI